MSSYYGKDFDSLYKRLKKQIPCKFPIVLRVISSEKLNKLADVEDEEVMGLCVHDWDEKDNVIKATIYLRKGLSKLGAELMLLHEYSHCLDGKTGHTIKFGINYSKCWKIYCEETNFN